MRPIAPAVLASVLLAGCTFPATEVLVVLGTDIPDTVPLTIHVTVAHSGDAGAATTRTFVRTMAPSSHDAGTSIDAAMNAASDAGISLPASFAVVPSADGPRNQAIVMQIDADAGGVLIHRTVRFTFAPNETQTLPVFITSRCADPATGCTTPSVECTVQQRCEEQEMTCGNSGACVPVDTTLTTGDASFGDVPAPRACGLYDQPCCSVGSACAAPLSCVSGTCKRCTDPSELCCTGAMLKPDGTVCAATTNPCEREGTCTQGVCGAVTAVANGATCGMAPDVCHDAPVCQSGTCEAPAAVANGTSCGTAPDACHDAPVCQSGTCEAPAAVANGTSCGTAPDVCHTAPTCQGGTCGAPPAVSNGTPCGTAPDACHGAPTCQNGACAAAPALPDGTAWGSGGLHRCCGGNAVTVDTDSNCGACGIGCGGHGCTQFSGQWYCNCTANSQCWSRCCVTFYGVDSAGQDMCGADANGSCSAVCINCPGNATCHPVGGQPFYCSYP